MIRWTSPLLALAITSAGVAPSAAAGEFLLAISDVPLADGLSEAPDPLIFESEQGRFVSAAAAGSVGASAVADFYTASLPALGWRPAGGEGLSFIRENEHLTITLIPSEPAPGLSVRFELIIRTAAFRLPDQGPAGAEAAGEAF